VAKKLERIDKKSADSNSSGANIPNSDNNNNLSSSDEDSDANSDIDEDSCDSIRSPDIINYDSALFSPSDSLISSKSCCNCTCHLNGSLDHTNKLLSPDNSISKRQSTDAFAQTLSTGDIVITKVYFQENQQ
jgi:hypothetical protein